MFCIETMDPGSWLEISKDETAANSLSCDYHAAVVTVLQELKFMSHS